jgi:hypothetical protein
VAFGVAGFGRRFPSVTEASKKAERFFKKKFENRNQH